MRAKFWVQGIQPKQRPRHMRNGHTYTPSKTREYEQTVFYEYVSQCPNVFFNGAVMVDMHFYIPKKKSVKRDEPTVKPDIDNLIKSVLDGLNGCAWKDDAQVTCLCAEKSYTDEAGGVRVIIEGE